MTEQLRRELPTADQAPPRSPVDDLIPGTLPPEGFDPLAPGILMKHQVEWVEDKSPLRLAEKGRRTGITFAEALNSTLIAAAARSAGGKNTFYIGDTKDKGLEFIAVCARFAETIAEALIPVEEFLFEDKLEDGTSRFINAYRIRFASGFQISGLSSRPANIRGLQGRVIIDEAAFHQDVAKVIDACNALLIWGGEISIISTHNGAQNPFNELIKETREGKYDYKLHHVTFDDAVENGLYERVCLINGWEQTAAGKDEWYRRVRRSYGTRVEAMREELDAIPREGEGVFLPLAWIEACSTDKYKVVRWNPPTPNFVDQPESIRRAEMQEWLEREAGPILKTFTPAMGRFALGEDFAMRQDSTDIAVGYEAPDLHRHCPLVVEMRQCPYDQQKQALFWVGERLPRLAKGVLDANGNGMVLAQEARQKFGADVIVELIANDGWYREHSPKFRTRFEDRTTLIPADPDVKGDLRQIQMVGGVGKVPSHVRKDGTDGGKRHADIAVALMNLDAALNAEAVDYGYRSAKSTRNDDSDAAADRAHRATSRFQQGAW